MAAKLLKELNPMSPNETHETLFDQAKRFVMDTAHWNLIESLASKLWNQPVADMPQVEIDEGWSTSKKMKEKFLSGSEVVDFFGKSRIPCTLYLEI